MTIEIKTEDQARDIAFAQGLLEGWLEKAPATVLENLKTLVSGVDYWKQKYYEILQQHNTLTSNYANLTQKSGELLQQMQHQKDQIDELLIDQQKQYHS